MATSRYIMRLHRITPEQDKRIKRLKNKLGWSESEIVRQAIDIIIIQFNRLKLDK